jgi:hypothetical protein
VTQVYGKQLMILSCRHMANAEATYSELVRPSAHTRSNCDDDCDDDDDDDNNSITTVIIR